MPGAPPEKKTGEGKFWQIAGVLQRRWERPPRRCEGKGEGDGAITLWNKSKKGELLNCFSLRAFECEKCKTRHNESRGGYKKEEKERKLRTAHRLKAHACWRVVGLKDANPIWGKGEIIV